MQIVTLTDPTAPVVAGFAPEAAMIGVSLTDDGVELLGQRHGLAAYLRDARTMGIPILYPWANRLNGTTYSVDGTHVTLDPRRVHTDANGLPIHGVLAGCPGWRVTTESSNELVAELNFDTDDLLGVFPFPHLLTIAVRLLDRALTVRTTVTATGGRDVPLCFGFHPYLRLPGVPRTEWRIDTPAMRRLTLDERGLPTGAATAWPDTSEVLGDKVFDDGFDSVRDGAVFAVSGGGRRIEVRFDHGYPAAQIYAPAGEDVVCFEPMAAPTDALCRGGYRVVHPGRPATAQFSIHLR